ncbi:5-bromo-4-chloroindolyl phosphate hydrolysis family protein [Schleiferilactobacillus shenzhenensis]|nr:5-bromo-4-chloroindolyl phosphate hydrolysis family protein [Schleiferilactobacillus shenzhenensis]
MRHQNHVWGWVRIAGIAMIILAVLAPVGRRMCGSFYYPRHLFHPLFGIGVMLIIMAFLFRKKRRPEPPTNNTVPPLTNRMQAHYHKLGMADEDITFFRAQMAEAKEKIDHLQANVERSPKLKAVDLNYGMVRVSQAMFQAIVDDPLHLASAGDFLYRHLPSLVNLTDKYIEISHHEVKTKDTWTVLAKSIEVITQLSQTIQKDYTAFVHSDLSEMDAEMTTAERAIHEHDKPAGATPPDPDTPPAAADPTAGSDSADDGKDE